MFYLDEVSIEECSKNGELHTACTVPTNYNLDRYQSPIHQYASIARQCAHLSLYLGQEHQTRSKEKKRR
jgi:hypothetical protein